MVALNHSRRYWRAVERLEPSFLVLDRRLGESWSEIPLWAHERPKTDEHSFDIL
jgi:hypothetical protein